MSVPIPDLRKCNSGSAANPLKTMSLTNAEIDGFRQLVDAVQNHARGGSCSIENDVQRRLGVVRHLQV